MYLFSLSLLFFGARVKTVINPCLCPTSVRNSERGRDLRTPESSLMMEPQRHLASPSVPPVTATKVGTFRRFPVHFHHFSFTTMFPFTQTSTPAQTPFAAVPLWPLLHLAKGRRHSKGIPMKPFQTPLRQSLMSVRGP